MRIRRHVFVLSVARGSADDDGLIGPPLYHFMATSTQVLDVRNTVSRRGIGGRGFFGARFVGWRFTLWTVNGIPMPPRMLFWLQRRGIVR